MSNWFKKKWFRKKSELGETSVIYSIMIPVDIKVDSTGDTYADQENVYNILEGILNAGSESQNVNHRGFRSNLKLNDIKPHSRV